MRNNRGDRLLHGLVVGQQADQAALRNVIDQGKISHQSIAIAGQDGIADRTRRAHDEILGHLEFNCAISAPKEVRDTDPYQDAAEMEHYLDLLRKSGLPE